MDIYAQEIARLADSTGKECCLSWERCDPLFQTASPHGEKTRPDGKRCVCLTLIRGCNLEICEAMGIQGLHAWTDALTREIAADERIPRFASSLWAEWDGMSVADRVAALEPFAEWQRRLDVEIRGKSPAAETAEIVSA